MVDLNMHEYSRYVETHSSICDEDLKLRVTHEFLNLSEEATFEQESLFADTANKEAIQQLFTSFQASLSSTYEISPVVVVSIGTSSTQVYTADGVVAAYFIGSASLAISPDKGPELIESLFSVLERKSLLASPVIICDSVGYFVSETLLLQTETPESLLSKVSRGYLDAAVIRAANDDSSAPNLSSAAVAAGKKRYTRECQLLSSMYEFVKQYPNAPSVFIQAASARPKIRKSWLLVKARQLADEIVSRSYLQYAQTRLYAQTESRPSSSSELTEAEPAATNSLTGIYLVDFGGGGARLYYYKLPVPASPLFLLRERQGGDSLLSAATTAEKTENKEESEETETSEETAREEGDRLVPLANAPKESMGLHQEEFIEHLQHRRYNECQPLQEVIAMLRTDIRIHYFSLLKQEQEDREKQQQGEEAQQTQTPPLQQEAATSTASTSAMTATAATTSSSIDDEQPIVIKVPPPPRTVINCYVYQTGMARQQYYMGNTDPSTNPIYYS